LSQPELEEALLLLRKAQEDADAVKKLVPDTDIADSVVGFHAQQAAEKALKAVLQPLAMTFPGHTTCGISWTDSRQRERHCRRRCARSVC
jgi:hypothetical protein